MHTTFIRFAAAIVMLIGASTAAQAGPPQLVIFALDLSDSASIAVDINTAKQAGHYVQSVISKMGPGDLVKIRTLGTAGMAAQQIYINVTLGKKARSRPHRIAPRIGGLIHSLPNLVRGGKIKIQPRTNIIGFLEALGPSLNCKKIPIRIVIFSDGIEWSKQLSGKDLLSGKKSLPAPSGPILKGCTIEMRGLGQQNTKLGSDGRWFPILKKEWTRFFKKAGAARFNAYAAFE